MQNNINKNAPFDNEKFKTFTLLLILSQNISILNVAQGNSLSSMYQTSITNNCYHLQHFHVVFPKIRVHNICISFRLEETHISPAHCFSLRPGHQARYSQPFSQRVLSQIASNRSRSWIQHLEVGFPFSFTTRPARRCSTVACATSSSWPVQPASLDLDFFASRARTFCVFNEWTRVRVNECRVCVSFWMMLMFSIFERF